MSRDGIRKADVVRIAAAVAAAAGWTVKEQARSHHFLAYPPCGGKPVGFSVSTDWRASRNVYAAFRRAGLELDPARAGKAI